MNPQQTPQLDQDVVNLAKAIRQVESGNRAVLPKEGAGFGGASRYQYSNDTWKSVAQKYLGDANAALTLENENQATYKRIKDWKDQGFNPGQIASMWNAGEGRPNAHLENWRGTNEYGVQYDTPAYARKVAEAYQQIKGNYGGTYQAPPPTPEPYTPAEQSGYETLKEQVGIEDGGLADDLGNAFTSAVKQGSDAIQRGFSGESNAASAGIQTIGAGAGAVGDIVDAGLSNIPLIGGLYEKATEKVGQAAAGAASATGLSDWFGGLNPDTQRNIGAALNIASVVPLFKGLGTVSKGIGDIKTGVSSALPEVNLGVTSVGGLQGKALDELSGAANATVKSRRGLANAEKQGKDPLGLILNNKDYMPDVVDLPDGRRAYDTQKSLQKIDQELEADELALQNLLDSTIATQKAGIGLSAVREQVLKDLLPKGKFNQNRAGVERFVNTFFDNIKESGGRDYITLSDLNEIKRLARKPINYDAADPFAAASKEMSGKMSSSLMKQVEEYAKKSGVDGVKELNKVYGERLTAKNVLEFLNNRPISYGQKGTGGLIKSLSREVPIVEGLVDYAATKLNRTPLQKLKAKRPLSETGNRARKQVTKGLVLSNQLGQEEQ